MYVPAHFEEERTEVLHDLISRNPFGILVTHCTEGLDANHLPFGLDREGSPLGVLLSACRAGQSSLAERNQWG